MTFAYSLDNRLAARSLSVGVTIRSVTLMSLAVDHAMASIIRDCNISRLLRLQRTGEKEDSFEGGKMLTGEDLAMRYGGCGRALSLPIFLEKRNLL